MRDLQLNFFNYTSTKISTDGEKIPEVLISDCSFCSEKRPFPEAVGFHDPT